MTTRRWVLLVSDDPALLSSLEAALEGSGLCVALSPDAVQGAAQARDLKPALIITDVKFDADFPLMLVRKTTDLGRLRAQVDELLNPAPARAPEPFLGGGIRISPPPRRGRRWVLFVREDIGLDAELEEAFSGGDLHLTTAADIHQAAVQARDLRPVLVVSDILTPQILSELRRDPGAERTPFIYIAPADGTPAHGLLPPGDASVRIFVRPFVAEKFKEVALRLIAAA